VYEARGETEKSLADLTRVTEIEPNSQSALLSRAVFCERIGKTDLASEDYRKLAALAPNEKFYQERLAALQEKGVTGAPTTSPAAKTAVPNPTPPAVKTPDPPPKAAPAAETPAALPTTPAKAELKPQVTAEKPVDCKVFVPAANLTVTIPCGK
jgi:tetratricopeptide (TPR) repeat protein